MDNIFITEEIYIRQFIETDFPLVQQLYEKEGWMTFIRRKEDALRAWKNSTIALVAVDGDWIIGLVRALTDGEITTYVAEIIVDADYRGKGIGKVLLDACHNLYPHTRLDLLSSEGADEFYRREKFREIPGFRKSYL
jgi:GNAT superfamily N-acetyltransferase